MIDPRYIRHDFDRCLAHFIEECGEALAAAGKTERWGLTSVNPEIPPEQQETNIAWLRRELRDLSEVIQRLQGFIDPPRDDGELDQWEDWKRRRP